MILVSMWSAKGEQRSESWKRREIKGIHGRTLRERSPDGHIAAQGILGCVHEKDIKKYRNPPRGVVMPHFALA